MNTNLRAAIAAACDLAGVLGLGWTFYSLADGPPAVAWWGIIQAAAVFCALLCHVCRHVLDGPRLAQRWAAVSGLVAGSWSAVSWWQEPPTPALLCRVFLVLAVRRAIVVRGDGEKWFVVGTLVALSLARPAPGLVDVAVMIVLLATFAGWAVAELRPSIAALALATLAFPCLVGAVLEASGHGFGVAAAGLVVYAWAFILVSCGAVKSTVVACFPHE